MYDELVARLRNAAQWANKGFIITPSVCLEAADAIEELQAQIDGWIEQERNALLKSIPRWIPVTERLPEAERKSYWVCTDTGYQCECRWTNNRFGIRELDEWGWCLFDIPPYQKVVAWMPLPCPYEPPEEGEA